MRLKNRKNRNIGTFDKFKNYLINKVKAIDAFIDDSIDEFNKKYQYSNIKYSRSNNEINFSSDIIFNTNSIAALFANDSNSGHINHDCHSNDSHHCHCDCD